MNTSLELIAYIIYLPISIGLTTLVSQHLFKNSKIFMLDIFHQKEEIAMATNKLFKIGFYLLNIGFALMIIKIYALADYTDLVETLSSKIGGFSIYLGVVMIAFILFFLKGRKASKENNLRFKKEQSL
jgi:F0F1-type ATP synthase assembly protein I